MKKLIAFLSIAFILYIIYYDVKIGTLPVAKSETIKVEEEVFEQVPSIPYKEVKVKAGDTLLSIVEKLNNGQGNSSIEDVIKDFEELNPDTRADILQIGKTYNFPIY